MLALQMSLKYAKNTTPFVPSLRYSKHLLYTRVYPPLAYSPGSYIHVKKCAMESIWYDGNTKTKVVSHMLDY